MNLLQSLIVWATVANGLLAGGSLDTSLVKLPTRRRIGNVAYATFARGNDLGNGLIVYPILGIGSALLVFIATVVAYSQRQATGEMIPLVFALITSILHSIATSQAAPVMLSLKNTPNDEAILKDKLDKFERWHAIRTIFQVLTFLALVQALIVLG